MSAPTGSVSARYADFPNLANHWSGLRATRAIGDQTSGVGARRRVELKPIGRMDETVTTWEEGHRIDTQNQPGVSVPIKQAESTLTLEPDDDGTLATFDYRHVPRGGPIGRLTGPLIDKMLRRPSPTCWPRPRRLPSRTVRLHHCSAGARGSAVLQLLIDRHA